MSIHRRLSTVSVLVLLTSSLAFAQKEASPTKNERRLKVAFVVSEGFNMIDFGGPWEVFNVARIRPDAPLFETYTVSAATSPVIIELTQTKLSPDYTFENAPKPDIIVVGAQDWRKEIPGLYAWLKRENSGGVTIMSVCVGSGLLADAGLLDGKQATTHHAFLKDFREGYTKTTWLEGKRFVRSSDTIWTAGGLTSGVDLALHLVAKRFGEQVAESTAQYLEYASTAWKGVN
jgi:transcriptional regulator GlxA family with amidase domain